MTRLADRLRWADHLRAWLGLASEDRTHAWYCVPCGQGALNCTRAEADREAAVHHSLRHVAAPPGVDPL